MFSLICLVYVCVRACLGRWEEHKSFGTVHLHFKVLNTVFNKFISSFYCFLQYSRYSTRIIDSIYLFSYLFIT